MAEPVPHIGIVASTAEGAALCYRTLCREAEVLMGQYTHPEITLHTFPLRSYVDLIDRDDWTGVAALMSQSAAKLARSGADLIICPNNTLHRAYEMVESPVPWLHIAHTVAADAAVRGFRRVGILGTQAVMEGSIYAPKLRRVGIESIMPEAADRIRIQHIIRTELIAGRFTAKSRLFFQNVIVGMAANGVEAVVLGCTELPMLLSEEHSALPLLDSTSLLARAALEHAEAWSRAVCSSCRRFSF